jgi:hypothetical protein
MVGQWLWLCGDSRTLPPTDRGQPGVVMNKLILRRKHVVDGKNGRPRTERHQREHGRAES